jgi:tetratricopeptide (TPR) repeat protein
MPDDPLVKKRATLLQIGKVYKELGEIDQALAAFQQVLQLDENYDEAYDELGQIYQEEGELEKALQAKRRALELSPENGDYSYYVGTLLFKLGRPGEAIAYLEKAKKNVRGFMAYITISVAACCGWAHQRGKTLLDHCRQHAKSQFAAWRGKDERQIARYSG